MVVNVVFFCFSPESGEVCEVVHHVLVVVVVALQTLALAKAQPKAIKYCANEKLLEKFQESNKFLDLVQKGLSDYLETKRAAFARFYFLSNDELLEVRRRT